MNNPKLIQQLHPNPLDNNYSKLMSRTKCFSMMDLLLKALFFLYFPAPITFLACFLLSLPSALALFGLCLSKNGTNKKLLLPALFHHLIVYIIPLSYFLIVGLRVLLSGAYFADNANDYRSACTIALDYDHRAPNIAYAYPQATLKRACHFTVDFNPFCYKGCSPAEPKSPRLGGITLGYGDNAIKLGIGSEEGSWTPGLNGYQKTLSLVLIIAAVFAFFAFHFHQIIRLYIELGKAEKAMSMLSNDLFADSGH